MLLKSKIIKLNAAGAAQKVRETKIQFEILLHFPFCQFVHVAAAALTLKLKLTEAAAAAEAVT